MIPVHIFDQILLFIPGISNITKAVLFSPLNLLLNSKQKMYSQKVNK